MLFILAVSDEEFAHHIVQTLQVVHQNVFHELLTLRTFNVITKIVLCPSILVKRQQDGD